MYKQSEFLITIAMKKAKILRISKRVSEKYSEKEKKEMKKGV